MSFPALPPAAEILNAIRSTSESLRISSGIEINEAAVDDFLAGIDREEWEQHTTATGQHGIRLPLKFDSAEEELNFLSTLALLNFLSGYRPALHRLTTRGSFSTILSLLLSSHLSSTPLSTPLTTTGLLASTPASLASLAQIQTHTEEDHPTMGSAVRVGKKDEEAWEVLELLAGVCVETGEILRGLGKGCLGEWVREKLVETEADPGGMIVELATTFPAFRDAYTINSEPTYLFKKSLWLLATLSHTFSHHSPPPSFPLPSAEALKTLPVFADNVLPSVLLHLTILLPPSSFPDLAACPLLTHETATRLRGAAVSACSLIVQRARQLGEERGWLKSMTEEQLDGWIWSRAKGEWKEVGRVGERGTVMY